ncbi:hypothetical protein [Chitinophaga solisilvae]|uniref:Uncharacterized protein n=1 Tax=Chitinophaga solisilvae TaxID=1233460 RepID=A0A433WKQ0_9BACT|nr:hypothetical protein [Chitinophaga solisilvae]NSL90195.1 hypothetical protein [Chitinophaga solisilvae]
MQLKLSTYSQELTIRRCTVPDAILAVTGRRSGRHARTHRKILSGGYFHQLPPSACRQFLYNEMITPASGSRAVILLLPVKTIPDNRFLDSLITQMTTLTGQLQDQFPRDSRPAYEQLPVIYGTAPDQERPPRLDLPLQDVKVPQEHICILQPLLSASRHLQLRNISSAFILASSAFTDINEAQQRIHFPTVRQSRRRWLPKPLSLPCSRGTWASGSSAGHQPGFQLLPHIRTSRSRKSRFILALSAHGHYESVMQKIHSTQDISNLPAGIPTLAGSLVVPPTSFTV